MKTKDQTNTSEKNYLKWKYLFPKIPSLYSLNQRSKVLCSLMKIQSNSYGFFVDVREKITLLLRQCYKNNPELSDCSTVKIKIAADGFQINKKGKQGLMICFSFIEPPINPTSSDGHFVLGKLLNSSNFYFLLTIHLTI